MQKSTTPYVAVWDQRQPGASAARPFCAILIPVLFLSSILAAIFTDATPPFLAKIVTEQHRVADVDWSALRTDLTEFVSSCGCAPILVRLSWHDAGTFNRSDHTGGSRGAQRFPSGESLDAANAGLSVARGLLQPFKERHPHVGYADLWALAAVVAVEVAGGPKVPFRAGRIDGSEAENVPAGRLPDASQGANHLRSIFYRMGFDDRGVVALSGAHTLGRCHADRSGFDGPWTSEPLRFDRAYFELLLECEWHGSLVAATGKHQLACATYPGLMMLPTDLALLTDPAFKEHVVDFAASEERFFDAFAEAFQQLQELGHRDLHKV